mgnify:CR=1 FL=1|jgi:hypothetical protein
MTQVTGQQECFWRQYMMNYVKKITLKLCGKLAHKILVCLLAVSLSFTTFAQVLIIAGPLHPAPPGRAEAPIDLTGSWVSLITEDWPYRMLTPTVGDTMSIPVNEAAREAANNWDLEADNAAGLQCRAFGAAGIMRVPTRLQISWEDDFTLRIDTDAGSQSRFLNFSSTGRRPLLNMLLEAASLERTRQGYSAADWENIMLGRGQQLVQGFNLTERPPGGNLKVITTQMLSGYLRFNGIPYSEEAILTEYFNRFTAPNGDEWLVVTTIVDDPFYLEMPYVTTSHFRREEDNSKWNPSPCETWAPPEGSVPIKF